MDKILIVGGNGQLGSILSEKLARNNSIVSLGSKELDIRDKESVLNVVMQIKPNIIINCAAYNKVDDAEFFKDDAKEVNELGVYYLGLAADNIGALLVHISTDYVFDGNKRTPYTELDKTNPINYYGRSKVNGEIALREMGIDYIIVRTSWLYSDKKTNFVKTIQHLAGKQESIKIINDQIGTPTNAYELADNIIKLMRLKAVGLYHYSGDGECSWYEFADKIVKLARLNCRVEEISSKQYKQKATRPSYSVLDKNKIISITNTEIKHWEYSLEEFFKNK